MKKNEKEIRELHMKASLVLAEGQVFKNLEDLLLTLGFDKVPQGNVRKRVIEKLKCVFDYEKIPGTHKLMIKRIFEVKELGIYHCPTVVHKEPLIKDRSYEEKLKCFKNDGRRKYSYPVIMLISDYATSEKNNLQNFIIKNNELLYILGFVNRNYLDLNFYNIDQLFTNNKKYRIFVEKWYFKKMISIAANDIISRNINSMYKYEFIKYFGNEYTIKDGKNIRFAENIEKELIESILSEPVFSPIDITTNITELKKKLNKYGLDYCGQSRHIIFNDEYFPVSVSQEEREELKRTVNNYFYPLVEKRLIRDISRYYNLYATYKNKKYEYPFECGDLDSAIKLMKKYMEKYIKIED